MDVQRLEDAGTKIYYDDGSALGIEVDDNHAHVQPGGSTDPKNASYGVYHYHGPPGWDDGDWADYVIGYAKDGVPMMGQESKLSNGQTCKSSYKLQSGKTGEFHMDYEYSSGSGTLDELNGGMFTIDGVDTYAYCSTSGYPYIFRNFKGSYS